MKIILTGSLGHIGKPLATTLVQHGHDVTVISSHADRQAEIEALGATAAIGSVHDAAFLSKVFAGADAVYAMVPPVSYFNPQLDAIAHFRSIAINYAEAIKQAGVKQVVNLSSWGAHRDTGNGGIAGACHLERVLNELPPDVSITHLRPTSFYYNLYSFIPAIKHTGMISANYGGTDRTVLVAPSDIADAVVEELENPAAGRHVRYVASDALSCNEVARILGEAIGKPDLKWEVISEAAMQQGLEAVGMPARPAAMLVELQAGHHKGIIAEDYERNPPAKLGKVKMADFAKEFAEAYQRS